MAGLVVDSAIHAYLAVHYALFATGISVGTWFRAEAAVTALVGLLVAIFRCACSDLLGCLTATAGLVELAVYHLGGLYEFSPFADLNEPIWAVEMTWVLPAQMLTLVCLTGLLVRWARRSDRRAT